MKKIYSGRYKKTNRGTIITKNIRVTASQYKEYIQLNKIVERKRLKLERMSKRLGQEFTYFGKQIKSLHYYKSQEEFNNQLKKLRKYAKPSYTINRDKIFFENTKERIRKAFNKEESRKMITAMNKMGVENYIKGVKEGKIDSIEFLYTRDDKPLSNYDQELYFKNVQRYLYQLS